MRTTVTINEILDYAMSSDRTLDRLVVFRELNGAGLFSHNISNENRRELLKKFLSSKEDDWCAPGIERARKHFGIEVKKKWKVGDEVTEIPWQKAGFPYGTILRSKRNSDVEYLILGEEAVYLGDGFSSKEKITGDYGVHCHFIVFFLPGWYEKESS